MTNETAQKFADMANAAEAAILAQASNDFRDFWMNLPRETRILVAFEAAEETQKHLYHSK